MFLSVLFFGLSVGFAASANSATPRGYFISVDGMRWDYLKAMATKGELKASRGLGFLYKDSLTGEKASPVDITLTAPSHTSTITCSTPATHGIVANSFILNGQMVNGFENDVRSETLAQSARRQGKKVISIGYVSVDGRTPERSVDYGISFPSDAMLGKSQFIQLDGSKLIAATDWKLSGKFNTLVKNGAAVETAVDLEINSTTHETKHINILISTRLNRIIFDDNKDTSDGILDEIPVRDSVPRFANLYFLEQDAASPLRGYKRRVFVRSLNAAEGQIALYFSKVTYNKAHPESYRKWLDDMNLVWPDEDMPTKNGDIEITPLEFVASSNVLSETMARMAAETAKKFPHDLVLFYQHLIDSLGHKYEASLPQPFNPKAKDPVTLAYVEAYRIVDRNISMLLEHTTDNDIKAAMGDHGMQAIIGNINMASLMDAKLGDQINFVTSGALVLLYPKVLGTDIDALGAELVAKLTTTRHDGHEVLGSAYRKLDAKGPWSYGEAQWALTSAAGYLLKYNAQDSQIFSRSSMGGNHGYDMGLVNMNTSFLLKGHGVHSRMIPKMSLIDAVPTFAAALGWSVPRDCQGKSQLR